MADGRPAKRVAAPRSRELCAFCHEGEDSDDPDDDPIVRTDTVVRKKQVYAHLECLNWCPDLYQLEDETWQNVSKALNRCHRLKCAKCGEGDAPLGCRRAACKKNWHYPCAMDPSSGLHIYEDEYCVACPVCHEVLEARRKKKERIAAELAAEKAMKKAANKPQQSGPAKSGLTRAPAPEPEAPAVPAQTSEKPSKGRGLPGLAAAIAATPGATLLMKEAKLKDAKVALKPEPEAPKKEAAASTTAKKRVPGWVTRMGRVDLVCVGIVREIEPCAPMYLRSHATTKQMIRATQAQSNGESDRENASAQTTTFTSVKAETYQKPRTPEQAELAQRFDR